MEKTVNKKRVMFYDAFNIPSVEGEDVYSHLVKQSHLDYGPDGSVIVVQDPDLDMYELIQSSADDSTLASQLKNLAIQGKTEAPGVNYMDVSDEPECLNDRYQTNKILKAQANKAAKDIGIDSDANDLVKLSDDDLMRLINSKVTELYEKRYGKSAASAADGGEKK